MLQRNVELRTKKDRDLQGLACQLHITVNFTFKAKRYVQHSAFNLLQLFVNRRLGRCRRPKDSTDTIRHIVEVMLRDVATLREPIPRWAALLLDTN